MKVGDRSCQLAKPSKPLLDGGWYCGVALVGVALYIIRWHLWYRQAAAVRMLADGALRLCLVCENKWECTGNRNIHAYMATS